MLRPVDLDMVNNYANANMANVAQIQQSILNGIPVGAQTPAQPQTQKVGASAMKKGSKNVPEPGNADTPIAAQIDSLGGAQTPQQPVPDTQAQVPPLAPNSQPQAPINLNDPLALTRAASAVDPAALVNPGTYNVLKDVLGAQGNVLRYAAPATGRVVAEGMGVQGRKDVANINANAKITAQGMKNKADNAPYQLTPTEDADLFNKTMGEFVKNPMAAITNTPALVAAIDSLPNGTQAKARAMSSWGAYYNKYKQNNPNTGLQFTEGKGVQPIQQPSPQGRVTADQIAQAVSNHLDNGASYHVMPDPISGVQKKVIPLADWQKARDIMIKNKVPLSTITNLSQKYIIGK